jgi:hypothetical protein
MCPDIKNFQKTVNNTKMKQVGATIPTPTISTQFLPANNADESNPDFNIDSNNIEK